MLVTSTILSDFEYQIKERYKQKEYTDTVRKIVRK